MAINAMVPVGLLHIRVHLHQTEQVAPGDKSTILFGLILIFKISVNILFANKKKLFYIQAYYKQLFWQGSQK